MSPVSHASHKGRAYVGRTKAAHHKGSHQVRAKRCTDWAWTHPTTTCRRCGLTHAEALTRWGETGAKWTAGHIVDGQVGGPYAPEHAHCNYSAGAVAGNRARTHQAEPHTERW
jgi:hypothetical protein